jgi:hypothetical protein
MSTVTIVNKTKRPARMLVFNLDKSSFPVQVVNRVTEEGKDGIRKIRVVNKLVPDSLRIPAGGMVKVDRKVAECSSVQSALARREISIQSSESSSLKAGQGETETESNQPKTRRRKG